MPSITIALQMRFGDIDAYGHANNVAQLQYLEDARVRLSDTSLEDVPGVPSGRTYRQLVGDRVTVVGRQEIEYLHQLRYRIEPLEVEVWTSSIGSSSYVLNYRIQEPGGRTVYAIAQSTTVEIDPQTSAPQRLSDEQRAFLEHHRQEPVEFTRRPDAESDRES